VIATKKIMLLSLLLLLFLPCAVANEAPGIQSIDGRQLLEDMDKVFNDFLLWTSNVPCRSKIHCAASCARDPDCVFFTVSKNNKGTYEIKETF
jgi:hypothetical protein